MFRGYITCIYVYIKHKAGFYYIYTQISRLLSLVKLYTFFIVIELLVIAKCVILQLQVWGRSPHVRKKGEAPLKTGG